MKFTVIFLVFKYTVQYYKENCNVSKYNELYKIFHFEKKNAPGINELNKGSEIKYFAFR